MRGSPEVMSNVKYLTRTQVGQVWTRFVQQVEAKIVELELEQAANQAQAEVAEEENREEIFNDAIEAIERTRVSLAMARESLKVCEAWSEDYERKLPGAGALSTNAEEG